MFIIIPLIINVYQLHNQIKQWNMDESKYKYKRHSNNEVCVWINSKIKLIYLLTFICGSSFSMIALCNCYLFQLSVFSMGLSRRQKAVFRNKRIFSVVLMENFPQLIIQIVTLITLSVYKVDENINGENEYSNEIITILSLIFTVVSIGLSISEYYLSNQLLKFRSYVIVSFEIKSKDIQSMNYRKFLNKIIFHKKSFIAKMARIFKIEFAAIDRLIPIHTQQGAIFIFNIQTDLKTIKHNLNVKDICKVQ